MGFDFSCIQVLWLDKNNVFKASMQKKGSQADSNDPEYYKALRQYIKDGTWVLRSDLKVIHV